MRNALDMGDNEEIIDIAKRFYRVCVLLLQLSFIMVSYTELLNCSVSESACFCEDCDWAEFHKRA